MVIIFGVAQDLKTDYRLLNIATSFKEQGEEVLLLVNTSSNEAKVWTISGLRIREFRLPFKGQNSKFQMLLKQLYLLSKVMAHSWRRDIKFWFFDEEIIPVTLFCAKRFILDLHEVPYKFLSYRFSIKILRFVEERSLAVIHANDVRREYMLANVLRSSLKNKVIENYLTKDLIEVNKPFARTRRPYKVYVQGLSQEERFPYNTIQAILSNTSWRIELVGSITSNIRSIVNDNPERINYHSTISPFTIPSVMKECDCSVVFYNSERVNTDLCAPNRLYWALALGLPVLTGNNTTFKRLKEAGHGLAICETDGKNLEIISKEIRKFDKNLDFYKEICRERMDDFIFDSNLVISLF